MSECVRVCVCVCVCVCVKESSRVCTCIFIFLDNIVHLDVHYVCYTMLVQLFDSQGSLFTNVLDDDDDDDDDDFRKFRYHTATTILSLRKWF